MKIRSSLKLRCKYCKLFKRSGKLIINCKILKHKQKQG